MSAISKYEESLSNAPGRGGGLHQHIMSTACLGVIAEIPPALIIQDMEQRFDKIKPNEALDAVKKASSMEFSKEDYIFQPTAKKPAKKQPTIDDFIKNTSGGLYELSERSPYYLGETTDDDAKQALMVLYGPSEYLFIGNVFDTEVKTVKEWLNTDLSSFAHIIPNPMTGKEGLTDMAKISYRCENTVADARFAVCEMDDVPIEKQALFWHECLNIGIPIAAIVHSGKKSLHAWMRVDCGTDVNKWNELVRDWWFKDFGIKYGLDSACQNRSRLSRLPGHRRDGAGIQELIYLNGGLK